MAYLPLTKTTTTSQTTLALGANYIPLPTTFKLPAKPPTEEIKQVPTVSKYEEAVIPSKKIEKALSFLQPTEGEGVISKSLKWLGRQIVYPFQPLAEDVSDIFLSQKILEGVQEGKYDPKILDEFEVLKKTSPQIVGDVAMAVIAVTPLREFQLIKGYPIISKYALTTLAKGGAKIGAAFGLAATVAEEPKTTPAELALGTISGAVGGALVVPALGVAGRMIKFPFTKIMEKIKGVKKPPTIEPTSIEKVFPSLYEKRLAEQGALTLDEIKQPPKLNTVEKLLEPVSPVRTLLQKDATASYIGLKAREVILKQRNAYQGLFDSNWQTIKKIEPDVFSKIVGLQEQGINIAEAPKELQGGLFALRNLEQKAFDLSKQAGADVAGWRFTPKNHFSHLWTGDQYIENPTTGKILGFATDRIKGIQELLRLKNENPTMDLVMKPRTQLYLKRLTPTELSQKGFFRFISQIADVMGSSVDDVLDEVSMEGIARIKPRKTYIGQWKFRKGELGDYTTDPTKIYPSLFYKLTKKIYIDPEVRRLSLRLNKIQDFSIRKVASDLIDAISGKYQQQILSYSLTGKITGLQAQLKLGARISPVLVNTFQRLYGLAIVGEKNFVKANINIFTKEGQQILERIGVSTEVPLFEGMGRTRVRKWYNPLYFFGKTEGGKYVGNRNSIGLSGYYKGLELPLEKINANMKRLGLPLWENQEKLAIDFARNVVASTQFIYDISDFPAVLRNNLGKTALQFKSYGLNQISNTYNVIRGKPLAGLELFYLEGLTTTQALHQAIVHFGTMFLQGGIKALGFGLERFLPASVLVWLALKAPVLYYGICAWLGFEVSASGTIELANLTSILPIEDAKKVWKAIQTKNPKELLAIDPAAYRIYRALEATENGGWLKNIETNQNIIQLKPLEIGEYAIGINPLRVSQEQAIDYYADRTTQEMNDMVIRAKRDFVTAIKNGNWELAVNILQNLKKEGIEIRSQDLVGFIKEGELPRLLRDFMNYRKSEKPELFKIIQEFYEQE